MWFTITLSFCVLVCSGRNPFGSRKSLLLFLFSFSLNIRKRRRRKSRRLYIYIGYLYILFGLFGHPTKAIRHTGAYRRSAISLGLPTKIHKKNWRKEEKKRDKDDNKISSATAGIRYYHLYHCPDEHNNRIERRCHTRSIKPLDGVCPFSKLATLIDFIISITHSTQCRIQCTPEIETILQSHSSILCRCIVNPFILGHCQFDDVAWRESPMSLKCIHSF